MFGLRWTAVVLTFTLSFGNCLAIIDKNGLEKIVHFIAKYNIKGQFSLAVNIPVDQDLNKLEGVFEKDLFDTVREKVLKDEVYRGANVVAAKFKKYETYTDHAEARVLDNINPLANKGKDHSLVFYSYLSPCGAKCTNANNRNNILDKINAFIPKWTYHFFVFSKVFSKTSDGTVIDTKEIKEAMKQLGNSEIGYQNIFRCYKPKNAQFQCINCFRGNNEPLDECVKNEE